MTVPSGFWNDFFIIFFFTVDEDVDSLNFLENRIYLHVIIHFFAQSLCDNGPAKTVALQVVFLKAIFENFWSRAFEDVLMPQQNESLTPSQISAS